MFILVTTLDEVYLLEEMDHIGRHKRGLEGHLVENMKLYKLLNRDLGRE